MEKIFKLKEHNTTVKTEIVGGLTTFFAMAYIIFVNPSFLSNAGMDYTAVMLATCVSAAIGTFLTAFLANVPFAQAPGMGLNAFFTYTICLGMGYTWQQGLAIVFISGLIFLAVAVSPLRSKIIASIPAPLKAAISAGIGLFICLIGLLNAGIVTAGNNLLDMGSITSGSALLALIGLLVTGILMAWKVKGALFIGILISTVIGIPMGVTNVSNISLSFSGISMAPTFLKLDFGGLFSMGVLPLLTSVVTFAICDCFDTVGTLIGTAGGAGMLDQDGNLPGGDKALVADAIATCTGALLGTSTVTTFVESSTGVSEGARTGLSSVVVGVLFLLSCVLAPIAGIIPSAATAPALIIVGMFMIGNVSKVDWSDPEVALPAFLTIAIMPFAYSISDGIGFGFISYTLIKLARGKAKEVPVLLYILSALFVVMYILSAM
ncbi:MAG: NCS2 family permease [Candidatus Limiplasma sp.]|nr:NCS2 family permease [Candidatus Limiplasma sp.]